MEEKTIEKTVYIAKDGKEFLIKRNVRNMRKRFLIRYNTILYTTTLIILKDVVFKALSM